MSNIIIMLVILVASCVGDRLPVRHWDIIEPMSDSLTAELEKYRYDLSEVQKCTLDSLRKRAEVTRDPRLTCRVNYWEALYNHSLHNAEEASRYALQAESIARNAPLSDYDRLRIKNLITQLNSHSESEYYKLFADLKNQTEQFGALGDSLKMADCLNSMGALFGSIGSPDLAQGYFQQAACLYRRHGSPTGLAQARYNLASYMLVKGHIDSARLQLHELNGSRLASISPNFRVNVLTALTLTYSEKEPDSIAGYIAIIDSLIRDMPANATRASGEIAIADYLNIKGDYSAAIEAAAPAIRFYKENGMATQYRSAIKLLASAYLSAGSFDSARNTLIEYVEVSEAIDSISRHDEIVNMENMMRIERMKTEMQWAHERNQSRLVTIILIILLCLIGASALIVLLFSKRRILRERLRVRELENEQLQLRKEACERRIMADAIHIENTKNILKSVGEKDSRIRAQLADDESWEAFKTTFEEIHPDFYRKLKESPIPLTEYDIRLCSYIAVGVGNKQIAQILNVQPESVKKSRTRLRKKLGLSHGDALEDFLRGLAFEGNRDDTSKE